ncbi:uncharacterized protein A1O9_01785 [Exophiala aquamarina CBS 119918]|uniref:Uncharacterized protein n=1 Tax=Exophiala aquamarina CBS 119918 TaxID=1182545 RepID=A0A072PVR9_9EURO|nr:uncharacterized protein A1O9_01785 [Exophiala aquamarina CBS 119918]KEF63807.1 hypothetical protein A1O9_01785 [Exophiala aquamarina CBS 119918]
MPSEISRTETSEPSENGFALPNSEAQVEGETPLPPNRSKTGQRYVKNVTPTQEPLASPSRHTATETVLGGFETALVDNLPVQPSIRSVVAPSFISRPTHSNESDTKDKNSTTLSKSTREAIRSDITAGRLTIPELFSKDSESTPPQGFNVDDHPLTPYQRLRYRLPFGPAISPPNPDLAFKVQIIEYTRQWILLAASISQEKRRAEVLDRAFDKYEKVWFEALRIGYASGVDSSNEPGPQQESSHRAGDRKARAAKPRKMDPFPHAVQVFVPVKFKNGHGRPFPVTPITVGELEEAGVTEMQIRKRADDDDYAQVEEIFRDLYDDLGRKVEQKDWDRAAAPTQLNPTGRDLFFYSLYLVQLYEWNLQVLSRYQLGFKTTNQMKNGKRNIEKSEQDRKLFLALALALSELTYVADSKEPSVDQDIDMHDAVTSNDTIEWLLEAIDMVLESPGFRNIRHAFEASGYPEKYLDIASQGATEPSHIGDGKKALTEILSYDRDRDIAAQKAENEDNADDKTQWIERVEDCETKIRDTKKYLREIAPLLLLLKPDNDKAGGENVSTVDMVREVDATVPSKIDTQSEIPKSPVLKAGIKRLVDTDADDGQNNPELPLKRQKLDINGQREHTSDEDIPKHGKQTAAEIENTNTLLPAAIAGQSTAQSQTLSSDFGVVQDRGRSKLPDVQASSEHPGRHTMSKKERYIQDCLLPLANKLLIANRQPPLSSTVTDFPSAKIALLNAGLPVSERNKLVSGYNSGLFNNWNAMLESDMVHGQDDLARADNLPLVSHSSDLTLLYETGNEAESHPATPPDHPERRSLIVKLGGGPSSDYSPAQFSCNSIFNHKGFRYRYARDSTLANRKRADEALDSYVRGRTARTPANVSFPRYGKYEAICLPDDPERKTIIQGIWDTKDGKLIEGADWFYKENRDHPSSAADSLTEVGDTSSGERGRFDDRTQSSRPSSSLTKQSKKATCAPSSARKPVPIRPTANGHQKKTKVNGRTRIRLKTGDAKHDASRNFSSGQTSKGNSNHGPGSSRGKGGRLKRATAKSKFVVDDFDGASSEEYVPGHSD